MSSFDYIRMLGRRWRLIAACVLIALPIGWFLSPAEPASAPASATAFRATTYLFAPPTFTGVRLSTSLETVATLARLGPVPTQAAEALNFEGDETDLLEQIRIDVDDTTGLLSIVATAPTGARAEQMADTFAEVLLRYLDERTQGNIQAVQRELDGVERRIARLARAEGQAPGRGQDESAGARSLEGRRQALLQELAELEASEGGGSSGLEILQPATAEAAATGESTGLQAPRSRGVRVALAALIGLIVGAALAFVRDRLDTRIRDRERAEEVFALPVLAEIPKIRRRRHEPLVRVAPPASPAANASELLAAALQFGRHQAVPRTRSESEQRLGRTILVTSAAPSEGKSTILANLAAAFAGSGNRVIVLCGDGDRSTLHDTFGVAQGPGLSDVLTEGRDVDFDQVLHQTTLDRVEVIPAGEAPRASAALLSSASMHDLLLRATSVADVVLIDAAPILATSDWMHLLPEVDAVLLVARAGATTSASAERAAGVLDLLQAPVVGIALNEVAASSMRRGYGHGYGGGSLDVSSAPSVALGMSPSHRGERSLPPAASNGNGKEEPVVTSDLQEAAKALGEGKRVLLKHERRSGSSGVLEVTRVPASSPSTDEPTADAAIDDDPPPSVIGQSGTPVPASSDQP